MPRDTGLQAFTIRLNSESVLLLRAYVVKQSQAQGGKRISYSSAVAQLVRDLPAGRLDGGTLRGGGKKRPKKRAKKKARAARA